MAVLSDDERLSGTVPFGHWQSQTFIAALRCNVLTAPWVIDGALDRPTFDLYIEIQLIGPSKWDFHYAQ